jgi:NAD+ synthase
MSAEASRQTDDSRVADAVLRAFPGAPRQAVPDAIFAGVPYRRPINQAVLDRLVANLRTQLQALRPIGLNGVVVGLSGGLDSVLCLELCRRALPDPTLVMATTVLVGGERERADLARMSSIADALGVRHVLLDGAPLEAALQAGVPGAGGPWTAINIETRVIQTLIFSLADAEQKAVCATTDRSEFLLARFTEHFYGHVAPLWHLYKTEAASLAEVAGVTAQILDARPGCPGHWYDDEVLGVGYGVVDPLLHLLKTQSQTPADIAARFGLTDLEWLEAFAARIKDQTARMTMQATPIDEEGDG